MNPKEEKKNTIPEQPQEAGEQAPQDEKEAGKEPALEALLKEAEAKRDEYLDMAQRLQAEFDNFRRRNAAVRSEAWTDGARETVLLMLPVVDNLERALGGTAGKNAAARRRRACLPPDAGGVGKARRVRDRLSRQAV